MTHEQVVLVVAAFVVGGAIGAALAMWVAELRLSKPCADELDEVLFPGRRGE